MAGLPPKPDDALPPFLSRTGTSPIAASMRSDRDRDILRDEWRRGSPGPRRYSPPRSDAWRRPPRESDRYPDHQPQPARDWDERERPRHRGGRGRGGGMDTYVPDSQPPSRRRSPHSNIRRRPTRSGTPVVRRSKRAVPSPSPYHRSPSPYSHTPSPRRRPARSESPRRHSPSRSHKVPSHERYNPRSTRSPSPRSNTHRRDSDHSKPESQLEEKSLCSKSTAASENLNEEAEPLKIFDKGSRVDVPAESSIVPESISQNDVASKALADIQAKVLSIARSFPKHPLPSGPRRPRTPTGPRFRSPAYGRRESLDDSGFRRESKGKGKEVSRDGEPIVNVPKRERSVSPSRGARTRPRVSSQSRSDSHSPSRSPCSRSRSSFSASQSPARSASQQTDSDRADSRASRKDHIEPGWKLPDINDLIPPLPPAVSKTSAQDAELKRIREQRAKLELEHDEVMRAVRRAQHELDLAILDLKSAEERRKAAERVHDRTVKGFLAPVI